MLYAPIHEERLLALIILVRQFQQGDAKSQEEIFRYYLAHTTQVNNWDLVDTSAHHIVGAYLYEKDRAILLELATSTNLWERRIAMVATLYFIRKGEGETTFTLAQKLLRDSHDLIHKATGWMLREAGKQNKAALCAFLDKHACQMPRTMLRYALEKFEPLVRRHYMDL